LSSALNAVAGRLVSPAPSSTFDRCRPGPRGLPGLNALSWPPIRQAVRSNQSISALVAFTSPSERSRSSGNSSQLPKKPEFLLSWDSPACRPSAVLPSARPLQEAEASFGPTIPIVESCSALVVSHHLDGLLRAGATGLLHPAAGHGVRRVSCFRLPPHPKMAWKLVTFPAPRVIPFEEFPSSAAVPHHCGLCPLAVSARSPCPNLLDPRVELRLISATEATCSESGTGTGRSLCQ
jgi:hypothetical protein